jgi:D-sedoheptulose 7-phosphate isomerase
MSFPDHYKAKLLRAWETVDLTKVEQAIAVLERARDEDRNVFICGNGGSAATANHFACDLAKGTARNHVKRFRVMSLSEQIPTITAYANDISYDAVFAEQLKNFAREGDVLIALSGSGNSENVIRAVEYANSAGCITIGLSGRDGGRLAPLAQLSIHVREDHMGRIEDTHMSICHMMCYHFMEQGNAVSETAERLAAPQRER